MTYFNAGTAVTFPVFVWGAARIGAPAQVNVIGTAIFVIAISGALANVLIQMRREKRLEPAVRRAATAFVVARGRAHTGG